MDIFKILNNDFEGLSEEEKEAALLFGDKVKELIIEELIDNEVKYLQNCLKNNKEIFEDRMYNILYTGFQGYSKMSVTLLINIFVEKYGNEKLICFLNDINL